MTAADLTTWPAKVKDHCANFFGTALRLAGPDLPADANVLEIGCAEFDWITPAKHAWPEMSFSGIDWRACRSVQGASIVQGDVLTHAYPANAFDWIVSISALEHVGLGHYKQDPKREDGDSVALQRAFGWLKPGGWLYFDVPYNPAKFEVYGTSHRVYDDAAIVSRLDQGLGWRERWRGVAGRHDTHTTLTDPQPLKGGEAFYYIGFWWQKPEV